MSTELEEKEEKQGGEDNTPMPAGRVYEDYSAEFKARALVALIENDYNYSRTARLLGIDRQRLWCWAKKDKNSPAVSHNVTKIKDELLGRWNHSVNQGFDVLPDKLESMSGSALSLHIGLGTDKILKLLGEPTQIVEHRVLVRRAYDEIKDLMPADEARQLISEELSIDLKPEEWKLIVENTGDK